MGQPAWRLARMARCTASQVSEEISVAAAIRRTFPHAEGGGRRLYRRICE
jgi:hypothetical protein